MRRTSIALGCAALCAVLVTGCHGEPAKQVSQADALDARIQAWISQVRDEMADMEKYRAEGNQLGAAIAQFEQSDTPGAVEGQLQRAGFSPFRLNPFPEKAGALRKYQLDAPDPDRTAQAFDRFQQRVHPVVRALEAKGKIVRIVFEVFRPSQATGLKPPAPDHALEDEAAKVLAGSPGSAEQNALAKLAKDRDLMLTREELLKGLLLPDPRALVAERSYVQSVLDAMKQVERQSPRLPRLPLLLGSAGLFTDTKILLTPKGYVGEATMADGVSPAQVQQTLGPDAKLEVGAKGLVQFSLGG